MKRFDLRASLDDIEEAAEGEFALHEEARAEIAQLETALEVAQAAYARAFARSAKDRAALEHLGGARAVADQAVLDAMGLVPEGTLRYHLSGAFYSSPEMASPCRAELARRGLK